jgi:ferredoxin
MDIRPAAMTPAQPRGGVELVAYVVTAPCIDSNDRSCIDQCPVDCIYQGSRMVYINPDECIECGACEPVCPVDAIFNEFDLPAQAHHYAEINAEFCAASGATGGAIGFRGGSDHPAVAATP